MGAALGRDAKREAALDPPFCRCCCCWSSSASEKEWGGFSSRNEPFSDFPSAGAVEGRPSDEVAELLRFTFGLLGQLLELDPGGLGLELDVAEIFASGLGLLSQFVQLFLGGLGTLFEVE